MEKTLKELPDEVRGKAEKTKQPEWIKPMLATLTHNYFSRQNWIYERKLDGERVLAFKNGAKVRLMSRNKLELHENYPEIEQAISAQDSSFIVDGEVVAFKDNVTSFSRLQQRMQSSTKEEEKQIPVFYYVFDILYLEGYDLTGLALSLRKSVLEKALDFEDPLRYLEHRRKDGEKYLSYACEHGWEGVIAKDFSSVYEKGRRSSKWLKFKCVKKQEFVIGGFTDPKGSRIGFGALLVGYYEDGALKYAGKVGTGYDNRTQKNLGQKLEGIEKDKSPFDEAVKVKDVHWVKPELVAEIGFEEWTDYNKLRQPRYEGLRRDKEASEVVREDK